MTEQSNKNTAKKGVAIAVAASVIFCVGFGFISGYRFGYFNGIRDSIFLPRRF